MVVPGVNVSKRLFSPVTRPFEAELKVISIMESQELLAVLHNNIVWVDRCVVE